MREILLHPSKLKPVCDRANARKEERCGERIKLGAVDVCSTKMSVYQWKSVWGRNYWAIISRFKSTSRV
jgi:hypothetical protein